MLASSRERWAVLLLGAWAMGSVVMLGVAPTNFRVVDELLQGSSNPAFRALVEELGPARARELLRYLSSELNRHLFLAWNVAQAGLGLGALLLVRNLPVRRTVPVATRSAFAIVVGLTALTPLITQLGRALDFVPRQPPPPELARFTQLHVGYTFAELVKLVLVALAVIQLFRSSPAPARDVRPSTPSERGALA